MVPIILEDMVPIILEDMVLIILITIKIQLQNLGLLEQVVGRIEVMGTVLKMLSLRILEVDEKEVHQIVQSNRKIVDFLVIAQFL